MDKNKFLVFIVLTISVLFFGCSLQQTEADQQDKDLTMFVATDIHYLAKNLHDDGEAYTTYLTSGDGKLLGYIDEIYSAFANDVIKKKPEILIISGDLTNNGEKESHMKVAEVLKEIEEKAGTKIFVIPGNHDISNPWARSFKEGEQYITDSIDAEEFEKIYGGFGYLEAESKDQASLCYLATPTDKLWLLMLDTSIYDFNEMLGRPMINGEIEPETLEWIKQCSDKAKESNAQIVTVMHHNLMDQSPVLNAGFTLDNSEEVLKVFEEIGLNLTLSGHVHIQNIQSKKWNMNGNETKIYDIVTSALSVYPVQYGVIKFNPSDGLEYNTAKVDVEGWAKERSITDENVLNFEEYSKEYAMNMSYQRTYNRLKDLDNYSEEDKILMAKTMSLLNINYFAGTVASVKKEVLESRGYQLLTETSESDFKKTYLESMISGSEESDTHLELPSASK